LVKGIRNFKKTPHRSRCFRFHSSYLKVGNPSVTNTFFRAGEIEAWGRGIQRIFEACRAASTPEPQLRISGHDLWLEFPFSPEYLKNIATTPQGKSQSGAQTAPVTAPVGEYVEKLVRLLGQREPLGNEDVLLAFSLKSRRRLRETYFAPAITAGLIEYTIPEKPNSRLQKYRLAAKGRRMIYEG